MFRILPVILFFSLLVPQLSIAYEPDSGKVMPSAEETVLIRYKLSKWSEQIRAYQVDFVKELLELSREDYGDYELEFVDQSMSEARLMLALEQGKVHMNLSSGVCLDGTPEAEVKKYTYPILNHLLGLRALIVHKEDIGRYSSLKTLEDFKKLRTAQKNDWPDTKVYESAGFDVLRALSYKSLIPMLQNHRYDFLPLSVLEAQKALDRRSDTGDQLAIVPNVYVYYPIQVMLCLTETAPGIHERVSTTLEHMFSDANRQRYSELLDKHFDTPRFNKHSRVFIFDNPNIDPQINDALKARFKQTYLSEFPSALVEE